MPAQQIKDLFLPLIGEMVWNVRGGYGSFLTLEFGAPHLAVREPVEPKPGRAAKVQRLLRRRGVSIMGDWHLFVQYCDWKISVADGSLDSETIGPALDERLVDMDGQHFVAIENGSLPNSWIFKFDLGGVLETWPSAAYKPTNDMWTLHRWNGDISAVQNDGKIVFEKRTPRQNDNPPAGS